MSETQITDSKSAFKNGIIANDAAFSPIDRVEAVMTDPNRDGNDLPNIARQLARELMAAQELINALSQQRNHEQRCVEQKTRLLKHERAEVQFEEKRSQRFRKERDAARKVVEFVVNDGCGREFFPKNLDGTTNEMFVKATAVGSESFENTEIGECAFCRGMSPEIRAKCTHKVYDML